MSTSYTIAESAEYLQVSETFVHTMIDKGRLTLNGDGKVEQRQLDGLAELMEKLKGGGIAAMVGSIDQYL
ncbi:helix-turn-helix domain-containing protein [Gilvimarinus sp. DA14]|uniref:helix-turn-helix domain-containing protein n=1 Tax=Gilvimarinus sp. DA14 TaxID=2956798 RepID=UPI0020B7AD52|nr:helix-turn-helix domain-containing protein [Gilvimarinus sp. DA14]UTF58791.1 helix-turn-helix domain-containing protein [Gilvimarinus sp. DA14]